MPHHKRYPATRANAGRANSKSASFRTFHTRNRQINFEAVNDAALRALLAIRKIVGREFVALNPTRADRRAGSFSINLRTGRWADFATGDRGGDAVSLIAYIERVSLAEAARRLAGMLGVNLSNEVRR
jgi:DNA primase